MAVVRVDHEASALQEVVEMLDGQVDSKELFVECGIVALRLAKLATEEGEGLPAIARLARTAPIAVSEASVVKAVRAPCTGCWSSVALAKASLVSTNPCSMALDHSRLLGLVFPPVRVW